MKRHRIQNVLLCATVLVLSLTLSVGAQQSRMSPEKKKALVRQWIHKVWDVGDFSGLEQFAAPGYAYAAPGSAPLGRKPLELAVANLKRDFPDNRNTIEGQVMEGDIVVTRGITHRTDTATGRAIEIPWMIWTRFVGDKIAEDWEVYDKPGSVQQTGTAPNSRAETTTAGSAPANSTGKDLEAAIRQSWNDFAKGKKSAYAADIAEDATEVWTDGKGVHDKAAVLREMDNVNLKSHSLSDFKVTQLGPDAALVTYRAKVEGANGKRTFDSDMDVTEIRVKREDKWKELRYHESERGAQPPGSPSTTSQRLPGEAASNSVETTIRRADAVWAEAIASKSVDQTLAVYAPEAVTEGSAMFRARGLSDFRAGWTRVFAEPDFALTWKTEHIVVTESGSLAHSSGTWQNGKQHGPFLAVWQKQTDGQWKVIVDSAWFVP